MRRVLIIGNAGSGKTTFAKALAKKTGLPLVHLDQLFWCGEWEHISREDFDQALQAELSKETWILDGNFDRTLPLRLQSCDTVFFFDLPRIKCLWGVTKRLLQNWGKTRDDMGGNCTERFDRHKRELYHHVWHFNRSNRKKYYALLKDTENLIVFRSRKQSVKYLREVVK